MICSVLGTLTHSRWLVAVTGLGACGGTLDAGSDYRSGDALVDEPNTDSGLPVDATSAVILNNDGPTDNWQGEYAFLLAATGLELRGLIINSSTAWPDLDSNVSGWQAMRDAATASGIQGLPAPTPSTGAPLVRPESGEIEDTVPNRSAGAELIVRGAMNLEATVPPLVIVTGGRLTDVADAYLIEPGIAERTVVVASLGDLTAQGALMGVPNGEMDPWANTIVLQRMRYVQVSAYYDQVQDVQSSQLSELPQNAFGDWIASKSSQILDLAVASDQVAALAVALPGFAQQVERATQSGTASLGLGDSPRLAIDGDGSAWLVTSVDGDLATQTLWQLLADVF
jgi:hypothetical protein